MTVLVVGVVREAGVDLLRQGTSLPVSVLPDPTPEELLAAMPDAVGILMRTSRLTAAMIEVAPQLKIVSRHGVGYDNVDVAALSARRIPLAVAATANMVSVAEHAFWMMLELAKKGRAVDRAVREGRWRFRDEARPFELAGRTLLVVGFGRIGSRVAARARAFDMRVLVLDPFVPTERIWEAGCEPAAELGDALPQADLVTLHCPLTPETRHLIDGAALGLLPPHAVLVNTARGGLVDEIALAAALRAGRLAGAGIDVLEAEPPPRDHPLLGLPNALLSPHSAGVTVESAERMAVEAAQNLLAGLAGRLDPTLVVNPATLG